jgi:hypothetical protein
MTFKEMRKPKVEFIDHPVQLRGKYQYSHAGMDKLRGGRLQPVDQRFEWFTDGSRGRG